MRTLILTLALAGCGDPGDSSGDTCSTALDDRCAGGCPTWDEALTEPGLAWGDGDDDRTLTGCADDGGFLVAIGYLWGTTYAYDAAGALVSVTDWSDTDDVCGDFSHTWGTRPTCAQTCELDASATYTAPPACP